MSEPAPAASGGVFISSSASTRGMAIIGGAVALLLLLLAVAVSNGGSDDSSRSGDGAGPHSTTSSRPDGTVAPATPPGRTVFADDFSGDAAGWEAEGPGAGSRVGGRYQVRVDPTAAGGSVVSTPRKAAGVSPVAPEDIRIDVAAHRISSTGQDASMVLTCRVTQAGLYAFLIGPDGVAIGRVLDGRYEQLAQESLLVDLSAVVRLQAVCRSDEGAQHLSFSVDGNPVVSADDTPVLPQGSVGFGAFFGEDSIVAEFDDFLVTVG